MNAESRLISVTYARRSTRGPPITAVRGPASSASPWHHCPTPIDTFILAPFCQGKTSATKQLAASKLGTVLPDLRRFQTSSTSKTPHSLQSPHDRTSPPADSSPASLRPPRCRHTTFSAAKSAPTTSVAPSQLHPARRGPRSRSRPAATIEPHVLTLFLQLAMLTLGTLFGTSYAMAGGSKKPQAGATPPLNASSPDEADFIKCAFPNTLPTTRDAWVRRSLTLEQEVLGQLRQRQEGGEQALDWGYGPMTMRCDARRGSVVLCTYTTGVFWELTRYRLLSNRASLVRPVYSMMEYSGFPVALCPAPFSDCFDQGPCTLHGMVHPQRPLDWPVTWARRVPVPSFLNLTGY